MEHDKRKKCDIQFNSIQCYSIYGYLLNHFLRCEKPFKVAKFNKLCRIGLLHTYCINKFF